MVVYVGVKGVRSGGGVGGRTVLGHGEEWNSFILLLEEGPGTGATSDTYPRRLTP